MASPYKKLQKGKRAKGEDIHEPHDCHDIDRCSVCRRIGVTHVLRPALAASEITAQIVHVPELTGDALGLASGTGLRSKMFVSAGRSRRSRSRRRRRRPTTPSCWTEGGAVSLPSLPGAKRRSTSSFRDGAQAPDLRCAIAHRGISRFRVRCFASPRNDGISCDH
jgi:hypothetical protein